MHFCSIACKLQHLLIFYFFKYSGLRHDTGIGGVDAVYIGVYLAPFSPQRGGQSNGGGVRSTPAQSGYVLGFIDPLESSHHDQVALVKLSFDAAGLYLVYPRPAKHGVGLNAGL